MEYRPLGRTSLEVSVLGFGASPLHMGMLTNRGAPDWHPAPPEVKAAAREAAAYCAGRGTDLATVALPFALDYDGVATTLVGMSTPRIVEHNVQAIGRPAHPELLAGVQDIIAPVAGRTWFSGRPENQDEAIELLSLSSD